MKLLKVVTFAAVLATIAGCAVAYPIAGAPADAYGPQGSISISYFYDSLAPYGDWIDYPSYGWCWVPYAQAGWRPYSDGRWEYTDYGWTWLSSEPWGWATSHYGRWWLDPYYGWVWQPGDVWGPAWVAWRDGPGWIGWAPLPPEAAWSQTAGFHDAGVVQMQGWCFVRDRDFLDTDVNAHLEPYDHNVRFIQRTHDVTAYAVRDGLPVDRGVDVTRIEHAVGRPIARVPIVGRNEPGRARHERTGAIAIFRPRVIASGLHEPPRLAGSRHLAPASRADIRNRAESVRRRLEASLAAQRQAMAHRHAAEIRRAAVRDRGVVRRRHAQERSAFERFAARQRQELQRRMAQSRQAGHMARNDGGSRGGGSPGRGHARGRGR